VANGFPKGIVSKNRKKRQEILLEIGENNAELWNKLGNEFYREEEYLFI
jgi:hypothetical protein